MLSIASSICWMSVCVDAVDRENTDEATWVPTEMVATVICWLSAAPTWYEMVGFAPFSSLMPLNSVSGPTRSVAALGGFASLWMEFWSLLLGVPFLYWTASSRTR